MMTTMLCWRPGEKYEEDMAALRKLLDGLVGSWCLRILTRGVWKSLRLESHV